mmetsp:Transcript_36654/g.118422  ORF Transcript_36654/g.118422 Transcript_36654/m.118422 type:complete len:271 (+) Transcript_36654:887-1699(+)
MRSTRTKRGGAPGRLLLLLYLRPQLLVLLVDVTLHPLLERGDVRLHRADHEAHGDDVAPPRVAPQLRDAVDELLKVQEAAAIDVQGVEEVHLLLVRDVQVTEDLAERLVPDQVREELGCDVDLPQLLNGHLVQWHVEVVGVTAPDDFAQFEGALGENLLVRQPVLLLPQLVEFRGSHRIFYVDRNDHVEQSERHEDRGETVEQSVAWPIVLRDEHEEGPPAAVGAVADDQAAEGREEGLTDRCKCLGAVAGLRELSQGLPEDQREHVKRQ